MKLQVFLSALLFGLLLADPFEESEITIVWPDLSETNLGDLQDENTDYIFENNLDHLETGDDYEVQITRDDVCRQISVTANAGKSVTIIQCLNLVGNWYGGPEQYNQSWPLQTEIFADYSYVTKQQDNQGIAERYWLSSTGRYIYVDAETPLFIDQNNRGANQFCLISKNEPPYPERPTTVMRYKSCQLDNARTAHEHAIENVLGKPSGIPDERMIRYPIWSTWAKYKRDVNEEVVLDFANQIIENGFQNSQLEIDDFWETCYGSLTFNTTRFPDIKNLTDTLKSLGFRVTLWIHPFINLDCEPYHTEAEENGYLVTNTENITASVWWNGNGSVIDFTNPEAVTWWINRLKTLQEESGIDSFKFDAGETSWLPQLPTLFGDIYLQPGIFTSSYVEAVSEFGSMIEVRVAEHTQNLPIFVRMLDKDSKWDFRNGLSTLITTLLQMNMVGYPIVLPDMVGGNGYGDDVVTKELFIRWLQANVFMPAIQYSYVPWDYDDETIEICKQYTELHANYSDKIIALLEKAVEDGTPVNPPIWWIDPEDTTAQAINDEFLLGEDLLVAPVVVEGALSRDIYLPNGTWRDELRPDQELIEGPTWLLEYPAALNELPYFTRVSNATGNEDQLDGSDLA